MGDSPRPHNDIPNWFRPKGAPRWCTCSSGAKAQAPNERGPEVSLGASSLAGRGEILTLPGFEPGFMP